MPKSLVTRLAPSEWVVYKTMYHSQAIINPVGEDLDGEKFFEGL
jgi:hypothetical protein